jgi:hypothetical protein
MRGQYEQLRESTEKRIAAEPNFKDASAIDISKEAERRTPILAHLKNAAETLDRTLAQIEKDRQAGKEHTVHVTASVDLNGMNDPGARVKAAADAARLVLEQAGGLMFLPGAGASTTVSGGGTGYVK